MFDSKLLFADGVDATAEFEAPTAVDFVTAHPTSGLQDKPLFVVLIFAGVTDEDATVTVTLEESADNQTFTPVYTTGAFPVSSLNEGVLALPLPVVHKRYLKMKMTPNGVTAGTFSSYLGDTFDFVQSYRVDGIEFLPGADDSTEAALTKTQADALYLGKTEQAASAQVADVANSLKAGVKVENAAHADAADNATTATTANALKAGVKVDAAATADTATGLAAGSKIDLVAQVSGVLAAANGGTGNNTGKADTAGTADTAKGLATGVKVDLASQVTGTLPVANGGTGKNA